MQGQLQRTLPESHIRTAEELAVLLQQIGDLSTSECEPTGFDADRAIFDPAGWIADLAGAQCLLTLTIPTSRGLQERWVAAEYEAEYRLAFGLSPLNSVKEVKEVMEGSPVSSAEAQTRILERYLAYAGPVTVKAIGGPVEWGCSQFLEAWL